LKSLPKLPASLRGIICDRNKLTFLPDLPDLLVELWCSDNQLLSLPELPDSLRQLVCSGNHLPEHPWNEAIPYYATRVKAFAEKASKERIVQRCRTVFEELAQTVWHPSRVERRMLAGVDMEDM
jgi:hypothetical protein